jgi:hypothetical protein
MRKTGFIFIVLSAVLWAGENRQYVQPKENNVGVYKNEVREVYEQPVFLVGIENRLLVLESRGGKYKVQNVNGQSGWVEKKFVALLGKSKAFVFDNAEVVGYLDNPTPVYILDSDDPNSEKLYLDRSFKNELKENIDKETVSRQAGKK